ncbi:LPS export ABC transporter periplasmic protein LptC [Azospirillum sp.]|uniref:LPS export ABC transporter periplasmic protein LptC n=1 Tax=Azospirillum sp. TaxID=34012 RepID=UPI002D424A6A|nr:LPS export ABC transporter periplasmic protein LptC [Azospirillum sp.]HYD68647.1 LPS export ABC transporter periplasmic protein LptC [Azospirillum sp.]
MPGSGRDDGMGAGQGRTAPRPSTHDVHRRRVTRPVGRVYSRFVSLMKFALPALALAMLALVAAWPSLTEPPKPKIVADKGQLEMIKPRYFSADEQNQPFSLVAVRAEQSADQPGIVLLDRPEAEMTEKNGTWVTLRSDFGWYDQNTGILKMRGAVHVMRDDGNEFTTDEAFADVRAGNAWGDVKVAGQGPQGEINAQGFRMTERGKVVQFLNSSTATVQSAERGAPAPAGSSGASAPAPAPSAMPAAPPPAAVPAPPSPTAPIPAVKPSNRTQGQTQGQNAGGNTR